MIDAQEHKFQIVRETASFVRGYIIGKYHETGGMCEEATRGLYIILKNRGIQSVIYTGVIRFSDASGKTSGDHTWLEVDDIIVDVTADQFNTKESKRFPNVVIGSPAEYPEYQDRKALKKEVDILTSELLSEFDMNPVSHSASM